MLRGIDVSSHQSSTYSTDGLSFVFVKATEGRTYTNPKLAAQTKRARDAGLVVGFYHFLWPGNLTAQAEYFVSKAPERAGDILAVDWETTSDGTHATNAEKDSFIRKVKALRPNCRVVLYCNRHFWLTIDNTSYAGDGLWIADYVTAGKPRIKAKWRFHQYTDDPLDKNVGAFSSMAALREWAEGA
jgi:GH25 family lysozyme M1 (1,4-beta-N-acetylmuramidase)